MHFRLTRRWFFRTAVIALGLAIRVAGAQRVPGVGDDATVLPKGAVRVSAAATWSSYNELYGPGGKLEALRAPLSTDSLGARQLEILRPLEMSLRGLAQLPNANVTLGPVRTDFSAHIARSSLTIDLGVTSRLMLTARVPYEHTSSEVVLQANPVGAGFSPNIGINPALNAQGTAAARNRALVDAMLGAADDVRARIAACATNASDPVCADVAAAQALVTTASAFASGIATTYGTGADTATGSAFVPMTNSTFQSAIVARVASLNTAFKAYIPELEAWQTPVGAVAPLSSGQANELLSESLGVAPLGFVDRSHLGDIELGARLLLLDSFGSWSRARVGSSGFRLALGGLVRLGTGQVDRPNELADIGTGDGQMDIEGNAAADFLLTERFWTSVIARYGVQLEDEQELRIPRVGRDPFLPAYREQRVTRDLGDYLELQATPRFVYNDYFAASAQWTYRRKGEDVYGGTFTVDDENGDPVSLDARILGMGTEQTEQRVGGTITFSTLRAFDRGRARLPVDIQLLHWQTVSGSGYVPKQFSTQVQVRWYTRLFGAPLRPRRTAAPATR